MSFPLKVDYALPTPRIWICKSLDLLQCLGSRCDKSAQTISAMAENSEIPDNREATAVSADVVEAIHRMIGANMSEAVETPDTHHSSTSAPRVAPLKRHAQPTTLEMGEADKTPTKGKSIQNDGGSLETTDFDDLIREIDAFIAELGGPSNSGAENLKSTPTNGDDQVTSAISDEQRRRDHDGPP
jgi:hypothetical protein